MFCKESKILFKIFNLFGRNQSMDTTKPELFDLLQKDPHITHVLATSIIGVNNNRAVTTFFKNANTVIQIEGHDVDIKWNHHDSDSTSFYTTTSIYSDRITRLHGIKLTRAAGTEIGIDIKCAVLKSL